MQIRSFLSTAALSFAACVPTDAGAHVGQLDVALSATLGGIDYHLTGATLRIDGPEARDVSLDGPGTLALTLPAGPYQMTLLEGWALMRGSEDAQELVDAQLLSDNPVSLFLGAGAEENLSFRFALADGDTVQSGDGSLEVGFELADAGVPETDDSTIGCDADVRINEVDYDQPSTDDAEFVELFNVAPCDASLAGVILEMVNGSNGEVYARVELDEVDRLAPQQLLVIGDDAVVAAQPEGVLTLPLPGAGLQNGPDSVRLVRGEDVLDVMGYGEGAPELEGTAAPEDDGEVSLGRCPDGFDMDDNSQDFATQVPSPGAPNAC